MSDAKNEESKPVSSDNQTHNSDSVDHSKESGESKEVNKDEQEEESKGIDNNDNQKKNDDETENDKGKEDVPSSENIPDENDETSAKKNEQNQNQNETEEAGEDDNEVGKKKKEPPTSSKDSLPPRPVKRARTAYFIFTDEKRPQVQKEHPGEGVASVARIMGQLWSNLVPEEKENYQKKAAEERQRVAKELEAWKAAGGIELEVDKDKKRDPNGLLYPLARIRKICRLDPEVRGVSKEAMLLITKCAELATAKLGTESVRVARLQNRRKLLPDDVAHVCSHREQFLFLKDDVKDLVQDMEAAHAASVASGDKSGKKGDSARDKAAAGSKPLTSYFGVPNK